MSATAAQLNSLKRAILITVRGGKAVACAAAEGPYFFLTPEFYAKQVKAEVDVWGLVQVQDGALWVTTDLGTLQVAESYLEGMANRYHAFGW